MNDTQRDASTMARVRAAVTRRVAVDARALAALRMALGALVLVDLAGRSTDLVAFYTDSGVVPRAALATLAPTFGQLSIHALWGSVWPQVALFAIAGVAAVALLVGYRTRLATFVTLVLLVSLHARNPAVISGGDSLLRQLLVWGLFLPLGARWSVDAVGNAEPRSAVASVATAGLLGQVCVVYAVNAIFKLRGETWLRGEAVEQVLVLTRHSTPLGQALLEVPQVLTAANYLWLGLLFASPLLPVLTGWRRAVLPALFAAMHAGMVVTMELGIFPLVSIAALLPFLPPTVWNRLPAPPDRDFARMLDGRRTRTVSDWHPSSRLRPVTTSLAALLLCGMLVVNAASVGYVALPDGTPDAVREKAWDMFAPAPPTDDGWYVAPATLASGRQIDALRRTNLTWDRPPDVSVTFQNRRWRKLLYRLRGPPESTLRQPLARYLCQRWNRAHGDDIATVRLVYVSSPTRPPRDSARTGLGTYRCDG